MAGDPGPTWHCRSRCRYRLCSCCCCFLLCAAAAARVLRAGLPLFLPPAPQHVRMWLLTLPPALHRYTDDLTGPGGLLLQWDEEVRAAGARPPEWTREPGVPRGGCMGTWGQTAVALVLS